jgi:hypothetical protein
MTLLQNVLNSKSDTIKNTFSNFKEQKTTWKISNIHNKKLYETFLAGHQFIERLLGGYAKLIEKKNPKKFNAAIRHCNTMIGNGDCKGLSEEPKRFLWITNPCINIYNAAARKNKESKFVEPKFITTLKGLKKKGDTDKDLVPFIAYKNQLLY